MREQWYGDHRDLIKWSVLVHLAEQEGLRQILQVLYLRPSARPEIRFGPDRLTVPEAVWRHFRDLQRVSELSVSTGIQVMVFDELFEPQNRSAYTESVMARIRALPPGGTVAPSRPQYRNPGFSRFPRARHVFRRHGDLRGAETSRLACPLSTCIERSGLARGAEIHLRKGVWKEDGMDVPIGGRRARCRVLRSKTRLTGEIEPAFSRVSVTSPSGTSPSNENQ